MEAHIASMQPTQVKNITSSCEICSGPHDTQYCMENPEQAFVEYASLRTDEAGGNWYTFKPEQNNYSDTYNCSWKSHPNLRLSKFEAGFKQQQSKITSKIDTVLKAIIDRMAGALSTDTIKNSKLNINPTTSPALSARSYPTVDPQCSSHPSTIINAVKTCSKEVGPCRNDEEIEWLNVEELLDLVDISEESVYESLIKEMPKCSLNYDFRIKKGDPRKVTFKTPYKDPERSELSSKGYDLLSSRIILSEDDYDRGCRKPSDLEDGFYRDTTKLGPKYLTGMYDEGEVTLYLMRRSLEVLRKFHWMILEGRFNQLSHVSSPLLSKSGEY
ncbi:hypothetical protein Tco_1398595 [Tanacetum coccineum]